MSIESYVALSYPTLSELVAAVCDRIEKGWVPQGGIAATAVPAGFAVQMMYIQAMVR